MEELSPRARRLVENGVIDLDVIAGSGPGGKITSGDILHAARVMEVEQSVARIETTYERSAPLEGATLEADPDEAPAGVEDSPEPPGPVDLWRDRPESEEGDGPAESATFTAVDIGGEPIAPEPDPWDEYHSSTEGFSERARVGADQSWGEAEAHLAAMAEAVAEQAGPQPASESLDAASGEEAAPMTIDGAEPDAVIAADTAAGSAGAEEDFVASEAPVVDEPEPAVVAEQPAAEEPAVAEPVVAADQAAAAAPVEPVAEPEPAVIAEQPAAEEAAVAEPVVVADQAAAAAPVEPVAEPASQPAQSQEEFPEAPAAIADQPSEDAPEHATQPEPATEVMMDFGTLELVDPDSVWAEGAEDFAPWFLAHSRQLGDVLELEAGLSDARQFTTKSATGVLGRDDNGEDVVVVSSKNAIADDSDLGRALGMAASSGAASVALVSAALHEDQLKALAWLNNQTKSGVKWYGIEMRVVRIADSPAAMLFELVASPPQQVG